MASTSPTTRLRLFDQQVEIVADIDPAGDELLVLTNSALPTWRNVGGVPVIVATVPDVDDGQWVWEHDGRTFIAVGSLAMEGYVAGLVAAQQAGIHARREQHAHPLLGTLIAPPLGGFVDPFGHRWLAGDKSPLRRH